MKKIVSGTVVLTFLAFSPAWAEETVRVVTSAQGETIVVIPEGKKPDKSQAALAAALADASRQDAMAPFWDLVHPATRACLSDEEKSISEFMNFTAMTESPVPENYAVQAEPVDPENIKLLFNALYGPSAKTPVQPTHALTLHYSVAKGHCSPTQTSKILYIAKDNDRWYEVMACNDNFPVSAADLKAKKAGQDEKTEKTYAALSDAAKADIRGLLRGGDKISALKKLGTETGLSMPDAYAMIDRFCYD